MMMYDDRLPVTAVIPCFRCAGTIRRAVASVVHQTRAPAQIILVDDGSGDDTLAVLRELERTYPNWIEIVPLQDNLGAATARNAGWAKATQPWIAFLDADDAWHPRKLEIQHAFMAAHPEVELCGHGHRQIRHEDGLPNWAPAPYKAKRIHMWPLLLSNKFVTPSVMIRRDIKHRFIENKRHMEDHMLWLEIVCHGGHAVKLSAELAAIYKRPFGVAGLSSQIWPMERSDLDNYRRLYLQGCLKGYQYVALCGYSLVKYVRRLLIHKLIAPAQS